MIYFPPLQSAFQTEALTLYDLFYICCIASSVLIMDEGRKWWQRRHRHRIRMPNGMGKKSKKKRSWHGKEYDTV